MRIILKYSMESLKRDNMINQLLIPNGVVDHKVIDAFKKIDRTGFVPTEYRDIAYYDCEVPVQSNSKQKMMHPSTAGNMLQKLSENSSDLDKASILQIGTGTGYFTALLSVLFDSVTTIDMSEKLINQSRENIEQYGIKNCNFYIGNGLSSSVIHNKFNYIVLTGSLPFFPNTLNRYFYHDSAAYGFLNKGKCSYFCKITLVNSYFNIKKLFETQIRELKHDLPNSNFTF